MHTLFSAYLWSNLHSDGISHNKKGKWIHAQLKEKSLSELCLNFVANLELITQLLIWVALEYCTTFIVDWLHILYAKIFIYLLLRVVILT